VLAAASLAHPAAGQVSLHATVSARYSTALVHDSIVAPIDVQPAVGPALRLSLGEQSSTVWTPALNLDLSWTSLRNDESGSSTKFNSTTILAVTVGIHRALIPDLTAGGEVGVLKYLPSEQTGLFRDGTDIEPIVGLGLYWRPGAARAHDIGLSLRYDLHRFTTGALRNEGFTNPQLVHRISLGVGARVFGKHGGIP